jgi:5-methylcytosine-specific restriction endonuclease McrA
LPYLNRLKQKNYQRKWIADRKWLYFRDKKCANCGITNNLQLDHINRKDKVSHSIWSWSEERRNLELSKCQILCVNCHLDKTANEIRQTNHGTSSMYEGLHCRCGICRAWNNKRRRGLL